MVSRAFIAKDMGFINTAGQEGHQAVTFRSGSDMPVMYRCSFDAYQDTVYAHTNRQLYRECHITGTLDFVSGNAASVFQSCNLMPRQPLPNQSNTIMAQAKTDPNQNTGFSIQKCSISANGEVTAPTYLGRPRRDYSTAAVMQCLMGELIDPKGSTEWDTWVTPPRTINYVRGVPKHRAWGGHSTSCYAGPV